MVRVYSDQYGLDASIIRPFNTFGPFQSARAIIGEIIIKCIKGENILSTEGDQTREFNYVDNIIDGFIRLATSEEFVPGPINIGSNIWIGCFSIILPGSNVPSNTIINAGGIFPKNYTSKSI